MIRKLSPSNPSLLHRNGLSLKLTREREFVYDLEIFAFKSLTFPTKLLESLFFISLLRTYHRNYITVIKSFFAATDTVFIVKNSATAIRKQINTFIATKVPKLIIVVSYALQTEEAKN